MTIGVSPAYFLSKFGEHFTVDDVVGEVPLLKEMGFSNLQLEITHLEHLDDWDASALLNLRSVCEEHRMTVSQLVAHFWIGAFADRRAIEVGIDDHQIARCVALAENLPGCEIITVPFGKFCMAWGEFFSFESYHSLERNLLHTMKKMCTAAGEKGLALAMELQPGAVIAGISGALRIMEMMDFPANLGYNFDTGHANAMREIVELVPSRMDGRLIGTHLCDNDGAVNLSLAVGAGSIDWPKTIAALEGCGYHGSYDLEIMCPPEEVERQYLEGKRNLMQFMNT
ncbi:MAG: TIM barrel protein [Sphaerochaetaceae bacterium]|jgi:sugar phosphate isomerase/epimerase|nr:TIM barrel protein [Sphaerochaetaceae bacterium]